MQVEFATANPAKTASAWPIFRSGDITLRDLTESESPQVPEDGNSIEENARKKAMGAAMRRGGFTIAEDTSLGVDALGGLPGISPTRWTGKGVPLVEIEAKLLDLMKHIKRCEERTATFRSAVAVITPDRKTTMFFGELKGHIVKRPQGYRMVSKFPYHRIFMPVSEGRVLAEIAFDRRSQISHRGQAMQKALDYIMEVRDEFEY